MRNIIVSITVVFFGCATAGQPAPVTAPPEQEATPVAPQVTQPSASVDPNVAQPPAPVASEATRPAGAPAPAAVADNGLNDLAAMTFGCPKAALNAAAREAAKVRSEGTYQFAYFGIVSDSHHAAYEVHFRSNYQSEPLLRYCVSIYCQQGWDPKNTEVLVTLLGDAGKPAAGAKAREVHCGDKQTHVGARPLH